MNLSGKTNYAELLLNCSPNSEYSLICIFFFFACFSTHPLQHLLLVDFLMMAILTDVKWYLIVCSFDCISLKMSSVEHSFMRVVDIYMSFWRHLFRSSDYFSIGLFGFLLMSCVSCLHVLEIKPLSCHIICKYFLPLYRFFLFCLWFPLLCKSL